MRGREVGVCAGGAHMQFDSSCTFGGPQKVFQLRKGRRIGKEGRAVCGGGHAKSQMKETAAGYRANEWPRISSLIEI